VQQPRDSGIGRGTKPDAGSSAIEGKTSVRPRRNRMIALVCKEVGSIYIAKIAYETESMALYVKFHKAGWFRYDGVPEHEHQAFIAAPSIGSHFHHAIRSKYQGVRVDVAE
jgi:hypothetical protein